MPAESTHTGWATALKPSPASAIFILPSSASKTRAMCSLSDSCSGSRLTQESPRFLFVFLKNRQALIIHFTNQIWMPSWMMSPSEAKTMSDFHYILGKSSFCLSLQISWAVKPHFLPPPCQSSAWCRISNNALEALAAAFSLLLGSAPSTFWGMQGKGWHLWVCIKQSKLIHLLICKQFV